MVPSFKFRVRSGKRRTPTAPLMIVNPQLETRNSKLGTMGVQSVDYLFFLSMR
jgi:hypothetical protein